MSEHECVALLRRYLEALPNDEQVDQIHMVREHRGASTPGYNPRVGVRWEIKTSGLVTPPPTGSKKNLPPTWAIKTWVASADAVPGADPIQFMGCELY